MTEKRSGMGTILMVILIVGIGYFVAAAPGAPPPNFYVRAVLAFCGFCILVALIATREKSRGSYSRRFFGHAAPSEE